MFMAIQHYDGFLGSFDYDDTQFELRSTLSENHCMDLGDGRSSGGNFVYCISDLAEDLVDQSKQYLCYIGSETDGSKIKIPDGIKSCMGMFAGTDIESVPDIPDSVLFVDGMCLRCRNLKTASVLPVRCDTGFYNVSTYAGCYNIESVIAYGDNDSYFVPCINSEDIFVINVGDTVAEKSNHMRLHRTCDLGCFMYDPNEFIPLSDGVRYIGNETDGSKIKIPDGVVDMYYTFAYNESLVTPPVIPEGVENCTGMFKNCSSLKQPPVIPDSVKIGVSTMFDDCPRSVRLKGQWNAEHRGQQYGESMNKPSQQREIPGFDFE